MMARVAVFTADGRVFVVPGLWITEDMTSKALEVQMEVWMLAARLHADVEWREYPVTKGKDGEDAVRFDQTALGMVLGEGLPEKGLKVIFLAGPEHASAEDPGEGRRKVIDIGDGWKMPDGRDPWGDVELDDQQPAQPTEAGDGEG